MVAFCYPKLSFTSSVITATSIVGDGSDITGDDEAYDATTWNAATTLPTKNAVRDKLEASALTSVYVLTNDYGHGGVTNSADETQIFTNTVPANLLNTNRTLIVRLTGELLDNAGTGSNFTFKVYFGTANVVFSNATSTLGISATRRSWEGEVWIGNAGTAAAQDTRLFFSLSSAAGEGINGTGLSSHGTVIGTAAVGTSTNVPVGITVRPNGAHANLWLYASRILVNVH